MNILADLTLWQWFAANWFVLLLAALGCLFLYIGMGGNTDTKEEAEKRKRNQ